MGTHEKLHVAGDQFDLAPEFDARAVGELAGQVGGYDTRLGGKDELYLLEHDGTGGTFTLTPEGGAATGAIAAAANDLDIKAALEAHAGVDVGDVDVKETIPRRNGGHTFSPTGQRQRAFLIRFVGAKGKSNRTDLTATFTSLTGESYNVLTKLQDGVAETAGVPLGVDPSIAVPTSVSAADAVADDTVDVTYTFAGDLVEIVVVDNTTGAFVKKQDATASPAAVAGLTEDTEYGFFVRGRTADGRVGPAAAKVTATPIAE